jgi:hypothetical protein
MTLDGLLYSFVSKVLGHNFIGMLDTHCVSPLIRLIGDRDDRHCHRGHHGPECTGTNGPHEGEARLCGYQGSSIQLDPIGGQPGRC